MRMQDFVGQYHAEQLYRAIISAFGVAGIAYGYYLQSFLQTTYVLLAGAALACVVSETERRAMRPATQ